MNLYKENLKFYMDDVKNSVKQHFDLIGHCQTWVIPYAFITAIINSILSIIQLIIMFPQQFFTKNWTK